MRTVRAGVVIAALAAATGSAAQPADVRAWVASRQGPLVRELIELLTIPKIIAAAING